MNEYDIQEALKRIEDELIASMIRNMERHRAEETEEGFEWGMWQAEQLKALEEYKKRNQERYKDQFGEINSSIPALISESRKRGYLNQEAQILESIGKGISRRQGDIDGSFFRINDRKMNALINATVSDMDKAETAMLRRANDQYRKTIFNAQVYANSGVGTYEKAVDMATKDFLAAGIQCIQYKNGSMHRIEEYAGMAIRTASKRAYLTGEGEKRKEWGCHLVIMNKRGNPCPKCLPFVGKILIDDVWSGGSSKDGSYPLMSSAMAAGLYHPNCKDSHTTYFPGISTPPDDKFSKKEIKQIEDDYKDDQKQQYAKRQEEKFGRLANYSLDPVNKKLYAARQDQWKNVRKLSEKEASKKKYEYENTVVNKKVINSANYRKRIGKATINEKVNRSIWQAAREMLFHRSGTKYEDLAFIDSATGKQQINKNFDKERTAKPNKPMNQMLRKSEQNTIIAIHNHPGSNVPSLADLRACAKRQYKFGMVVGHDGKIYKYNVDKEKFNASIASSALDRMTKSGYNEKVKKMFNDAGVEMQVL